MSKRGRKGRVSHQLVAASCAAILAVYAAGYWRTRDEARRFETQAQARRPARPAPAAPVPPGVPASASPSVASQPVVERQVAGPGKPSPPTGRQAVKGEPPVQAKPATAMATTATAPAPAPRADVATTPPSAMQASAVTAAPQPVPQPEPVLVAATPEPAPPAGVVWHDGVYTGWGRSFHGDIEARVVIRDGRIRTSEIATCATRYPCYVIETIFNQPVDRQSADVDRVSRATESADAYSDAVWQALQKAEEASAASVASP